MDYHELERAYQESCQGRAGPYGGICKGALLNGLLSVTYFDNDRWYLVVKGQEPMLLGEEDRDLWGV